MSNDGEDIREAFDEDSLRGVRQPSGHQDGYPERPKKLSLADALRNVAEEDPGALGRVARRIFDVAEKGEGSMATKAWDTILDRFDGKVVTPFALTGFENLTDEQLAAYREALTRSKG